jgi:hypothetical protein
MHRVTYIISETSAVCEEQKFGIERGNRAGAAFAAKRICAGGVREEVPILPSLEKMRTVISKCPMQ